MNRRRTRYLLMICSKNIYIADSLYSRIITDCYMTNSYRSFRRLPTTTTKDGFSRFQRIFRSSPLSNCKITVSRFAWKTFSFCSLFSFIRTISWTLPHHRCKQSRIYIIILSFLLEEKVCVCLCQRER